MRTLLLAVLALLSIPACKEKKKQDHDQVAWAVAATESRRFQGMMCACNDAACVRRVHDEMSSWSQDRAKRSPDEQRPMLWEADPEAYKYLAECEQQALRREPAPRPAPPPLPPPEKITSADRVISKTYETLGEHAVKRLVFSYVRADGTIDDEYGEATIELGRPRPPKPGDDPNRPMGAPVRKAPEPVYDETATCPTHTWTKGERAIGGTSCVMNAPGLRKPTCSITEVWKRAIERGAPKEGLAVIELRGGAAQRWTFAIDDEPRNIRFRFETQDGCAPVLEAAP